MENRRKRAISIFFYMVIMIIVVFSLMLIWPIHKKYNKMKAGFDTINEELAAKSAESVRLNKLVHDLENDPKAVEKVAREKFGLCKEGEMVLKYKE